MAKVQLRGVTKSYADLEVIHGVDMDVADGEFIVIVGPSGCGKSTLLRMVAGLEAITAGEIVIGDRVVNRLEPKDRDIAMVFQNYALYPHMSVFDNMAYGLRIRGLAKSDIEARVKRAAEILELGALLERKPRQLSGGQRQRVAMGRAIVREPAVFLFDEPLSNLDAKLRVQMRFEIQKLHRRLSTTSLYVTHDQVEAMTLAHRMIVMNAGRAEQIGTPMEVYENPATVFVAGFIGSPAMNFLPGKAEGGGRIALDGGGAIATGVKAGDGRKITVGVRPEHLTPCAPSAANLVGSVEMIEALGADTLIHVAVAGGSIIARLPHGAPATVGEPIALAAVPARVYVFDAETGARIGSGS
jgi:sn-glycerol 3-phosphate transport system ATP-binding protein